MGGAVVGSQIFPFRLTAYSRIRFKHHQLRAAPLSKFDPHMDIAAAETQIGNVTRIGAVRPREQVLLALLLSFRGGLLFLPHQNFSGCFDDTQGNWVNSRSASSLGLVIRTAETCDTKPPLRCDRVCTLYPADFYSSLGEERHSFVGQASVRD